MTATPLLSVIIPVYNGETFVQDAIGRAAAQTVRSKEIIVVNDGSTDSTSELAHAASAIYENVRVLDLPSNLGVANARSAAVATALGQYVWFVDADDAWAAEAGAILLDAAARTSADVVIAAAHYEFGDGSSRPILAPVLSSDATNVDAMRSLFYGETKGHLWNKLFRRSLLRDLDFTTATVHSDLALVAQALAAGTKYVSVVDDVYAYRIRPGSIIGRTRRRSDSLRIVETTLLQVSVSAGLASDESWNYFRHRNLLFSRFKDAIQGDYSWVERRALARELSKDIQWPGVMILLRRSQVKVAAMLAASKLAPTTSIRAANKLRLSTDRT